MLQEIHIQNYAVIDELSVEFRLGLNLLSGETGSGKSIVVDALGLALGGRATTDIIRTGCEKTTITAVFQSTGPSHWTDWLEKYGLEVSDEGELIFRRVIQAGGKSRLLVNDQVVTLAAVKAFADELVEIHGQNEQASLFSPEAQLRLLDRFGGADDLRQQVADLYDRRRGLEAEVEALGQNEQDRLRAIDLLNFQLHELDQAALEPGEDSRLEEEKQVLVHLEKIQSSAAAAYDALYEDENSACERVGVAARAIEDLRRFDSAIDNQWTSLSDAKAQLEDVALTLRDYIEKLEAKPHRLEEVEDRLALLDRIKRKYGRTLEEALAYREQVRRQLLDLEHSDERREELAGKLEVAASEYRKAAERLSQHRREVARRLEKLIGKELAELGMEKTRFCVRFKPAGGNSQPAAGGPHGLDQIAFQISPNPGEDLRPLEKIASGGELSRIMLALKTVLGSERRGPRGQNAKQMQSPTFIFDEVDTGIGGRVAEKVGQRLKRLARDGQVLCVTHLAQIACFADHHFHVEKFEREGRSLTRVRCLAGDKERAAELARMLSGSQVTDAVLKHAATMLRQAVG